MDAPQLASLPQPRCTARRGAAGVIQLGEVRADDHIVKRVTGAEGVDLPEDTGVDLPDVRADGGGDQGRWCMNPRACGLQRPALS